MGACYFVSIRVNLTDEKAAVDALNKHIESDTGTNYLLEKYAGIGIGTSTFDDLMKILLAGIQGHVDISHDGDFMVYQSDFNATYGWESVMIDWFEVMAPFLADGSELLIYPDEDYDKLVIKGGKCVWIH